MPILLVAPSLTVVTNSIGSAAQFNVPYDYASSFDYLNAITEAIYSHNGGTPKSILKSTPFGISIGFGNFAIFEASGTAVYRAPGTYEWTIKATGYEDTTVTVEVVDPTSVTNIQSTDINVVQVDSANKLIFVNASATVADIKAAIESVNGTTQSYSLNYSYGDDMIDYTDSDTIGIYSSNLNVLAENGINTDQFTIFLMNN